MSRRLCGSSRWLVQALQQALNEEQRLAAVEDPDEKKVTKHTATPPQSTPQHSTAPQSRTEHRSTPQQSHTAHRSRPKHHTAA